MISDEDFRRKSFIKSCGFRITAQYKDSLISKKVVKSLEIYL